MGKKEKAIDPAGLVAFSASKDKKMESSKDIAWDDRAILTAAGERPEPVRKLLAMHSQSVPSEMAVYQWWSRMRIPDTWRPRLVYALLREKKIHAGELFRVGSARRRDN